MMQERLPMEGIPVPTYMGVTPPWMEPAEVEGGWRFDCTPCRWVGETFEDRSEARRDAWLHVRGGLHRTGYRGPPADQGKLL